MKEQITYDIFEKLDIRLGTVLSVKNNKKTHPVIGLWKTKLKDKLENSLKNDIRKIDLFTSKINIKYVDYFFDKNEVQGRF